MFAIHNNLFLLHSWKYVGVYQSPSLVHQAFLGVVSESVDQLDESISRAEKELDPSKIRKVFSVLPKLVGFLSVMELNIVIWPPQFRCQSQKHQNVVYG